MRRTDRVPTDYGAILVLEALVGLLAFLGTVAVLLVTGVAVHAVSAAVRAAGFHPAVGAVASHLLALVALLVLVAAALFVPGEYRRFLDRSAVSFGPVALAAGPLAGVAGPFAYAVYATESVVPARPLLLVAVVAAHALAFRTIAAESRDPELAPLGDRAALLAGLPALVALITVVTERLLVGPAGVAGRLLLDAPGWGLVPRDGLSLVVVPLLVATAFGAYRHCWRGDRVDVPEPDRLHVTVPLPPLRSSYVEQRRPSFSLTDLAWRITDRLAGYVSGTAKSSGGAGGGDEPPVPTPIGTRPKRSERDGTAPSPARPSATASAASRDGPPGPRPPRSASVNSSSSDEKEEEAAGPERRVKAASAAPDADGEADETDDGTDDAESAGDATADAESNDVPDSDDSTAGAAGPDGDSDTEIYSPAIGDEPAGAVVETCPDCGTDVPSDGTYRFCPFCGVEL